MTVSRDASGAALFGWRAVGRGRIGVWTLGDAAGMVTAGFGDPGRALWAQALAAVARPVAGAGVTVADWPVVGERRATICGAATVVAPDGGRTAPIGSRCAGYWPRMAGWHVAAGRPFHADAATISGLRAAQRREATLALGEDGRARCVAATRPANWPWWLAFLLVAGGLWWLRAAATRDCPDGRDFLDVAHEHVPRHSARGGDDRHGRRAGAWHRQLPPPSRRRRRRAAGADRGAAEIEPHDADAHPVPGDRHPHRRGDPVRRRAHLTLGQAEQDLHPHRRRRHDGVGRRQSRVQGECAHGRDRRGGRGQQRDRPRRRGDRG
ncbi:hypothetical protein AB5I41_11990 [Sphingomonas sp. MMS24-JH45]